MSKYNYPGKQKGDKESYWEEDEEQILEEGDSGEGEIDQEEEIKIKKHCKLGSFFDLDWAVGDYEYNITVYGESEDWYIEEIEKYKLNSNKLDIITGKEFEEIEQKLNNDNDFIDTIERFYAEHSAEMAEWYRDQEIDRKIEEDWFRKRGVEI